MMMKSINPFIRVASNTAGLGDASAIVNTSIKIFQNIAPLIVNRKATIEQLEQQINANAPELKNSWDVLLHEIKTWNSLAILSGRNTFPDPKLSDLGLQGVCQFQGWKWDGSGCDNWNESNRIKDKKARLGQQQKIADKLRVLALKFQHHTQGVDTTLISYQESQTATAGVSTSFLVLGALVVVGSIYGLSKKHLFN